MQLLNEQETQHVYFFFLYDGMEWSDLAWFSEYAKFPFIELIGADTDIKYIILIETPQQPMVSFLLMYQHAVELGFCHLLF